MNPEGSGAPAFVPWRTGQWTRKEDHDVMRLKPHDFQRIYGRSLQSIKSRREYLNCGLRDKPLKHQMDVRPSPVIPVDVMTERERRLATAPRDRTAAVMGDPLPGYSALDKYKHDIVSA